MRGFIIGAVFLYLTNIIFVTSTQDVTVSASEKTWFEGMSDPKCQLLDNSNLDELRVRVTNDKARVTRRREYWIGAHVQYTRWMRLSGCYRTPSGTLASTATHINVNECSKVCNGSTFGLSTSRCACLGELESSRRGRRNMNCRAGQCPGHPGELCGSSSPDCLCIYEYLTLDADDKIGNCKAVLYSNRKLNEEYQTRKCSEKHGFLCRRRLIRDRSIYYSNAKIWSEAGLACHKEHGKQYFFGPVSGDGRGRHGLYWIAIFRKDTMQWGRKVEPGAAIDCVSATIADGKLQTFVRKCNTELQLLCEVKSNVDGLLNSDGPEGAGVGVVSLVIGLVGVGVVLVLLSAAAVVVIVMWRIQAKTEGRNVDGGVQAVEMHYLDLGPNRECNTYDVIGGNTSNVYDYVSVTDLSSHNYQHVT